MKERKNKNFCLFPFSFLTPKAIDDYVKEYFLKLDLLSPYPIKNVKIFIVSI